MKKKAIIIGAGPAGLTAAYELLHKTDIQPIIYEMTADIGGISKTINFNGNRIDIGGHRFFSKSDIIMKWWQNILPVQGSPSMDDLILERHLPLSVEENAPDPEKEDKVMLIRNRVSRIYFLRKFFNYPVSLDKNTFNNLGIKRIFKIGISYLKAQFFPQKEEKSLEDFFIRRFGKELYLTFFKDYTEKVWGIECKKIGPEWGAQRIKGLSVVKAVADALKNIFFKDSSIDQKSSETSLIRQFLYPKYGPGQLWEEVAGIIVKKGGELHLNSEVTGIHQEKGIVTSVEINDMKNRNIYKNQCDYLFSSMPVKNLVRSLNSAVPEEVRKISEGLVYRDFITVGLLLKKLKIRNMTKQKTFNNIIPDNWIYIQERDVKLGRLQIFNNWSPYMVTDKNTVLLGLEYFCNEGDELWSMNDNEFSSFAIRELASIDIIEERDVIEHIVIRMPKTYPAYFGTYDKFDIIRKFTDGFSNLFLIGRNGMHRYNNQDHSMFTAIRSVENIINNVISKENIWNINIEKEYQEQ